MPEMTVIRPMYGDFMSPFEAPPIVVNIPIVVDIPNEEQPLITPLKKRLIVELKIDGKNFLGGFALAAGYGSASTGLVFGFDAMCAAIKGPLTSEVLQYVADIGALVGLPAGTGTGQVMQSVREPLPKGFYRASSAARAAIIVARIALPIFMVGISFATSAALLPTFPWLSPISMLASFSVGGALTCFRRLLERRLAP